MDFVSEITKNQQRQQEINTALKHTEKDYQQSLKELQKKNKELTSCQSTSRSSETHLKQNLVFPKQTSPSFTTWKKKS